jgi:hypothetical protein
MKAPAYFIIDNCIFDKPYYDMAGITYIILISVENYNEPKDFPKVSYADKDAKDLTQAFMDLGYDQHDFILLPEVKATRTAIIQKVKTLTQRANPNDRLLFYFAGHGCYIDGKNYLAPVDAMKTAIKSTCISMEKLISLFKKSPSKKIVFFLDCCHSGPVDVVHTRRIDDSFMADELIYQFGNEEYFIGFSSCKSNQTSISHPKLQNGVWTHFLIKALKGEAGAIYDSGVLFSDRLQNYLNKETAEFVKFNSTTRKEQTPMFFGNLTDRFILADINPVFEKLERIRTAKSVSFTNIFLFGEEEDMVKKLPGFDRKFHKEPTYYGSSSDDFIKKISKQLIKDEIDEITARLQSAFKYKRKEISAGSDIGIGSIETPDFEYQLTIEQSPSSHKEYLLTRKLINITNADLIENTEFNKIFAHYFGKISIQPGKPFDLESIVDRIEELDDANIKLTYDPRNLNSCTVDFSSLQYLIEITADSFNIISNYHITPQNLVEAFKQTQTFLLANPGLKLLEEL